MAREGFVDDARRAGVRDEGVLDALRQVPRRMFVPDGSEELAEFDAPVPLPCAQTTSQPSLIALMVEALNLEPGDTVLEVGTGFGFQAALLSQLAARVWTIEWWPELADAARANLQAFGAQNVDVITGDGGLGLADHAPYDAIIVSARADAPPLALLEQLGVGANLVIPVGPAGAERCQVFRRASVDEVSLVGELGPVRFVPLIAD